MHSRIAWSYSGLIAYINDKHKVFVTWLCFSNGSKWQYAPPIPVPLPSEGIPLHLSWSATNYDLAISDDLGRLHIITIGVSGLPTSQLVASAVRDQRARPAELHRLVGLHWLRGSEGEGEKRQGWIPVSPMKPFIPVKVRSSLVAVNGNGMLRLLVQAPDLKYTEVDELIPGASLISRVTFLELNSGSLLIVAVTNDNLMVIYEVNIAWTKHQDTPETSSNAEKQKENIKLTIHEVISTRLVRDELISLVAVKTNIVNNQTKGILIRAVYPSHYTEFSLAQTTEALHHSFFELFNASDPVPPEPVKIWRFVGSPQKVEFESKVKHYFGIDNVALVIYANGKVISEAFNESSVLQLDKVGLHFDKTKIMESDSLCVSPSGCCITYFPSSVSSQVPEINRVSCELVKTGEEAKVIASALAANFANLVLHSTSTDDLMMVCWEILNSHPKEYRDIMFNTLAIETQKGLHVPLGVPEDPSKAEILMMNPSPFQRWLSFLSTLETYDNWNKTPGGYMCYILMHLHQLSFSITWTMRRITQKSRAQSIDQYRMEIQACQYHLTTMLGPIRWATDLIIRITQELYSALKSKSPLEYLMVKPNVFCALLMSSISRYLLRYFLRAIRTLNGAAKNLTELEGRVNAKLSNVAQVSKDSTVASEARASLLSPSNYLATHAFKKLAAQIQSLPVKLDIFEKFILNIEEKYKLLVSTTKIPDDLRASLESEMVTFAKIPQKFAPLVKVALDTSDKALFPPIDIPNLYFYDTTWLGLEGVCDEEIDGVRKRIILPQEITQVCSRCNIKSVYGSDTAKQPTQWIFVFQRHCLCGGIWKRDIQRSSHSE